MEREISLDYSVSQHFAPRVHKCGSGCWEKSKDCFFSSGHYRISCLHFVGPKIVLFDATDKARFTQKRLLKTPKYHEILVKSFENPFEDCGFQTKDFMQIH